MHKHLISTIFSVIAPLAAFAASDDYLLTFSTPGPDRYVDGTIVPDGECYALVWSPAGKAFSGFNADGTAASALDRVVLAGPLALDGRCRDSIFQVPKAEYDALEGGTWSVCLVDTRRANGVPAGVKDGKPLRVNRWGVVNGGVRIEPASVSNLAFASPAGGTRLRASAADAEDGDPSDGARATNLSTIPASFKPPTITELQVSGGVASLWVADTVDYLTYTIESCESLGNFKKDIYADKCDGVGEGYEILLETDASGTTRFFRVTRAE